MIRERKTWLALAATLVLALAFVPGARSAEEPADCSQAKPDVRFSTATLDQLSEPVRQGDSIDLSFRVLNEGPPSCFLSDIKVSVRAPSFDGDLGVVMSGGATLGLAGGVSVDGALGLPPYTVNLRDAIIEAPLEITWEATASYGGTNHRITGEGTGTRMTITHPLVRLSVERDPRSGPPPLRVTNTYWLTNESLAGVAGTSTPGLVPTGSGRNVLSDPACDSITYVSGDEPTEGTPKLDPGETWKFTCTRTFLFPGTYDVQPTVYGTSDVDSRSWPQPVKVGGATTVKVTGPDLVVDKSHQGDLIAGSPGSYRLAVTNGGNQTTNARVTVIDQLPAGLTATAIAGDGWDCSLASVSCTRDDPLGASLSFPDIKLTVIPATDPPASVINKAFVGGGGEAATVALNNADSDPTVIRNPGRPDPPGRGSFKVRKVKSLGDGKVSIKVDLPLPGRLVVDDAGGADLVPKVSRSVKSAGARRVVVKAGRKLRRRLKNGPRRVSLRIAFREKSGQWTSTVRSVRFRL